MSARTTRAGWVWAGSAVLLSALAVPWFLWRDGPVVAGWHIGWMLLAAVVFSVFARRAWGVGIEEA